MSEEISNPMSDADQENRPPNIQEIRPHFEDFNKYVSTLRGLDNLDYFAN